MLKRNCFSKSRSAGLAACLLGGCLLVSSAGCTDAARSQFDFSEHQVTLYSGGKLVQQWTSTGKVKTEADSDGYYFRDKKSQRLVRVSGTLVIIPVG